VKHDVPIQFLETEIGILTRLKKARWLLETRVRDSINFASAANGDNAGCERGISVSYWMSGKGRVYQKDSI
jgi:hypothetical protein